MPKLVMLCGIWYFGLTCGSSLAGILSRPQTKFAASLENLLVFKEYPYLIPFIVLISLYYRLFP